MGEQLQAVKTNEQTILTPSLWKTCRVLANTTRLKLLRLLLKQNDWDEKTYAATLKLSANTVCLYLKHLQARGLCRAVYSGRFVYYQAIPDPLVRHAKPLLDAFREIFKTSCSYANIIRALTAYTHLRRLSIISVLKKSDHPLDEFEITGRTRIPWLSCRRHLDKLQRHLVVIQNQEDRYSLTKPHDALAAVLLSLCN